MQSSQPELSDFTPTSSQTANQTDTPHSVITISTTDSQNSVISLSSSEDLYVQSTESNTPKPSCTTNTQPSCTTVVQFGEFTEFHASSVRYCQGLTISGRSKIGKFAKKAKSSNVTDIQIYMTEGQECKLLPESEETCPIYALYKSNKVIAILVDRVEPGEYLLTGLSKRSNISSAKNKDGLYVKKAKMSKYNGSVTSCSLDDSQILVLGPFHKQPLICKMYSNFLTLTAKMALLQDDISQTLLEQTSLVKHEQIFLQFINEAAKQMVIVENKNKLKQLKAGQKLANKNIGEAENTAVRKRPHFQLRIVMKEKSKRRKRLLTDRNQNSQSSVENSQSSTENSQNSIGNYSQNSIYGNSQRSIESYMLTNSSVDSD